MAQPKRRTDAGESSGDASPGQNVVPIRIDSGGDPLDSFKPEHARPAAAIAAAAPAASAALTRSRVLAGLAICALVGAGAAGALFWRGGLKLPGAATASPLTGRAILNSRPDGAVVIIDGASRGITPLELDLAAGTHDVVFRTESSERRITLRIDGGTRVSENVDMPASAVASGALEIVSDPAGARVTVDGTAAGLTPLTLRNITPAKHVVTVARAGAVVNRTVDVASGSTASVFISLGAPPAAAAGAAATGSFVVESPLDLRVLEEGQLIGVSNGAPIVLTAGKHQLDFVNESLDVHMSRAAVLEAGKTTRLAVAPPTGTLSVNAAPWAEVFVDGRSVGVTPLGAISVPVGTHDVVWRHPQFGERRRSVTVGAQGPTRISMDLSK